jgi:hypothetical protein
MHLSSHDRRFGWSRDLIMIWPGYAYRFVYLPLRWPRGGAHRCTRPGTTLTCVRRPSGGLYFQHALYTAHAPEGSHVTSTFTKLVAHHLSAPRHRPRRAAPLALHTHSYAVPYRTYVA